jgi:hypothetical protein
MHLHSRDDAVDPARCLEHGVNARIGGGGRRVLWFIALLMAFALCGYAKSPEWLDACLTPEAKAWHQHASAVVLVDQAEVRFLRPDRAAYHVFGAIRVNTISGRERLRTRLPYNPDYMRVDSVQAWIIPPAGKVTPVSRKEFMDTVASIDARYWDNRRVLSYNASQKAEVGSVLAWEFSYEAPADFWDVAWGAETDLPLWHGRFEVIPAPGCTLTWHRRSSLIPDPVPGGSPGALLWRVEQLAPLGGDRPTGFHVCPTAVYVRCLSGDSAVDNPAESWTRLSRAFSELVEPRAAVTPEVSARASELVRDKTDRWDRVRSLAEFAQKKIIYLALTLDKDSLAGCRPHPAAEVLRNRLGDCKDKATLLVALLRAIGDDGYVVLVRTSSPLAVDPAWPANQFNHAIVGISADSGTPGWWPIADFGALGRLVLFDPTNPDVPLGCLPLSDQAGHVLAVAIANGNLAVAPGDPVGYGGINRTTSIVFSGDGHAEIRCEERSQGLPGALQEQRRQVLGEQRFSQELERRLQAGKAEIHDLKWTADWDPVAARSTLKLTFHVERVGRRVGRDEMLLASPLPWISVQLTPWKTKFEGVSRMPMANFEEEIRIGLPPGSSVAELPSAVHLEQGDTKADFEYVQDADAIVCRRRFVHPGVLLEKPDYEALRVLVGKMEQADRRPIILKMLPAEAAGAQSREHPAK